MTALDDRPIQRFRREFVSRAAAYEWHAFMDGLAHLYPTDQIHGEWPPLLLPWCEEDQRFPLRHDRGSVTPHAVLPIPGRICGRCEHRVMAATLEALRAQGLIWKGVPRGEA
jgi:hypothetical protein